MTGSHTKFAVLPEPASPALKVAAASSGDWGLSDAPRRIFTPRVFAILLGLLLLAVLAGEAAAQMQGQQKAGVIATLWRWLPLILFGPQGKIGGFSLNLLISFLTMAIGTVTGVLIGILLVSRTAVVAKGAHLFTQFFRNSPWLVLLYFATLALPYKFHIGGQVVDFPLWMKAVVGLALPVMANIAEVTRGAIVSLPSSQWEAAEALAFTRAQTFRLIILPQCVKRMTPPWMNWYAILTMATTLVSIVGMEDALTMTKQALDAETGRGDLFIPMYLLLLTLFFIYCYPMARWTQYLERRYAVVT